MLRRYHRFIGLVFLVLLGLAAQGCTGPRAGGGSSFEITTTIYAQPEETPYFALLDHRESVVMETPPPPVILEQEAQFTLPHVLISERVASDNLARITEYTINDVVVQEKIGEGEDDWVTFSEFDVVKQYATDIGVVIILDNSASLKAQLNQARRLATRLAKELLHDKRTTGHVDVAIMPLAVQAGREITFSHKLQDAEVQALQVQTYAYTHLFNAIDEAIKLFEVYEGANPPVDDPFEASFAFEEKFIVVISDGQDNTSGRIDLDSFKERLDEAKIKVYALAVQGTDPIHEPRLQELAQADWYLDLSTLTAEEAIDRMATVKDTILQACRDRYNLTYLRSSRGLAGPLEVKFILQAEPKFSYETEDEPTP